MSRDDEPSTDLVQGAADDLGEEVVEEVGRFVGTIFGSASMELDQLLGDRVGFWRWKQSIRLAKKAKKMLDDQGLTPQQVPLRTSIPLLEGGSLAEDDGLVERWAALLANAASGAEDVGPSFASVLADIEPVAARLLDHVWNEYMCLAPHLRGRQFSVKTERARSELVLDEQRFAYHVDNLARLGLIRLGSYLGGPEDPRETVHLTAFGEAFVRACRPPGTADPPIRFTDPEVLLQYIAERDSRAAEEAAKRATAPLRPADGIGTELS